MCILFYSYAQDNVLYHGIRQAKNSGEKFEPVSALTLASKSVAQSKRVQDHFINPQEVYFLHYRKPAAKDLNASMTLNIPLGNRNLQLELQEYKMEYQVTTSDVQTLPPNKNIQHYQGIIKDDPHSIVAISFGEDEIIGLVATDEGNFNLALDKQSGAHIFYNDKNVKQKQGFICGTKTDNEFEGYSAEVLLQNTRAAVTQKYVRLYFETTFDIFQARGSNVGNVETFITGLYNQVSVLYRNESINTSLSQIHVWNIQDPYANIVLLPSTTNANVSQNLNAYLSLFQNTRTSFDGDLGQLVTFRNLGGGEAAGFNGLCNNTVSQRLSVAMIENSFSNYPAYSWSVYVITHEFGHLFGSRHTHACVWNGNNTAIDGCAPVEGSCSRPGNPSGGGTIMSYCHQQSVGVLFNLGFGTQPGNVIRNSVVNSSCLIAISGDNLICFGSPKSFSVTNWQSGYMWDKSSNLSLSSTFLNPTTVSGTNSGLGWVIVKNSGGTELARFYVWIGLPIVTGIWGPNTTNTNYPQYFRMEHPTDFYKVFPDLTYSSNTSYTWTIYPGASYYHDPSWYHVTMTFSDPGPYELSGRATNSCGSSNWIDKYFNVVGQKSCGYPNPVDDILTVDLEQQANARSSLPGQTTYDVRLYDGQGNLLRQQSIRGGTVQFNVANLPNGIYYLHIYDRMNSAPEMQQIMVEH